MKHLLTIFFTTGILISCNTKQMVIDTGVADGHFQGNMMEYLRSDKYNWELTVEMIEHAGLTDLFEGKVDTMPMLTFWGVNSYSIFRFIMDSRQQPDSALMYFKVSDIPSDKCREYILKHVVKGKHMKSEIKYRNKEYYIGAPEQDGGSDFTTLGGNVIRAYLEGSPYGGVPDAGPVTMSLFSITLSKIIPMASPDIEPANGVVHALNYDYEFPKI